MQLSEPPEPPPRNRINASINKLADSKTSLDSNDRTTNYNKPLKAILSLETNPTFITSSNINLITKRNIQIKQDIVPISETTTIKTTENGQTPGNRGKPNHCSNENQSGLISETSNATELGCLTYSDGTSTGDLQCIENLTSDLNSVNDVAILKCKRDSIDGQVFLIEYSIENRPNLNSIPDGNRNEEHINEHEKHGKYTKDSTGKLRFENEKLKLEILRLRKLLANSPDGAVGCIDKSNTNNYSSSSCVESLESELKIAKTQITSLRAERKKLRSDKNDLIEKVRQLCISLQDKEQELRDFIRNFEQRIKESATNNAKISSEREHERWSLIKHARDEAKCSLLLAQQLNAKDFQLQRTQEQLQEVKKGSSDRDSTTGDINLSDIPCENGPCITVDPDSISLVSSQHTYQFGTPKERSPTLSPLNSGAYSSRSVEQLGSPVDFEGPSAMMRKFPPKINSALLGSRIGRGGAWDSISRVFARSRNKNKTAPQDNDATEFIWSTLSEDSYAEKLRLLREASSIPIERWRASQVLSWLEIALGMPQYSSRVSENVKSGKVLLELNDTELETGLGLTHPMHRKKLRLAIEEHRRPDMVRYLTIGQLGHTWVASEWLPDIGLQQYADSFIQSLVDARMLDTLSKKELEKFLGVTRKFHQASIVHGIHVLRIIKYDRQTLAIRRVQSENSDTDPIVWTNQRFIRWARSIDLGEYADNLKDSGVHGGLVVLEPSFSSETMAAALGIPPAKNIIRRHLSTEFDALVLPARTTFGQGIRSGCEVVPIGPRGLHQLYSTDRRSSNSIRVSAWKGSQNSLSHAFRFNTKPQNEKSSPTTSYSSSEGGFYATIGPLIRSTQPITTMASQRVSAPNIEDIVTATPV